MSAGETTLEVPPQLQEFLQRCRTLTLATASPAAIPHASTFLYVNEGANLYFWTRATTMTARQIQQNSVVAFTIDGPSDDLNATQGVQGIGECTVLLDGMSIARVADLFGQKFPELAPGSTMSISFFRITPTELDFIDNTSGSPTSERPEGTFGADFHRKRSYSVIMDLPVRPAQSILVSLQQMSVSAGDAIVRQGTPADKFLVIVDGEVELVRDEGSGETVVASLGQGQLFGEVAIMRDQPRTATARAKTDVKLLAVERDTFKDLIAQAMELTPDFDDLIRARLDAQASD
jgi:uncharacterized protein YhbP (UPF0306 family)